MDIMYKTVMDYFIPFMIAFMLLVALTTYDFVVNPEKSKASTRNYKSNFENNITITDTQATNILLSILIFLYWMRG